MGENNNEINLEEYYLNDYGKVVFRHYCNKKLFLHRPYYWQDRIIMLDESSGRQHIDSFRFSTFDLGAWEPVTKEQAAKVKGSFTEIYEDE